LSIVLSNAFRGVVGIGLLVTLAGCSTGGGEQGALDLGANQAQPPAQQQASAVPMPQGQGAAVSPVVQGSCPPVSLRDGTAFYRTYPKGVKNDASKVIYQASLADSTRACSRDANNLYITVMIQGRLTAGPLGKAGDITLPVRVAVVDGEKVLHTELVKYPSRLDNPSQPSQFVFTKENIAVPGVVSGMTRVYVGFDEGPYNTK
jgi:hypothetical protein